MIASKSYIFLIIKYMIASKSYIFLIIKYIELNTIKIDFKNGI